VISCSRGSDRRVITSRRAYEAGARARAAGRPGARRNGHAVSRGAGVGSFGSAPLRAGRGSVAALAANGHSRTPEDGVRRRGRQTIGAAVFVGGAAGLSAMAWRRARSMSALLEARATRCSPRVLSMRSISAHRRQGRPRVDGATARVLRGPTTGSRAARSDSVALLGPMGGITTGDGGSRGGIETLPARRRRLTGRVAPAVATPCRLLDTLMATAERELLRVLGVDVAPRMRHQGEFRSFARELSYDVSQEPEAEKTFREAGRGVEGCTNRSAAPPTTLRAEGLRGRWVCPADFELGNSLGHLRRLFGRVHLRPEDAPRGAFAARRRGRERRRSPVEEA